MHLDQILTFLRLLISIETVLILRLVYFTAIPQALHPQLRKIQDGGFFPKRIFKRFEYVN